MQPKLAALWRHLPPDLDDQIAECIRNGCEKAQGQGSGTIFFRADDVALPPPETVIFDTYRPPPNVQRGKCVTCGQPAVTVFTSRFLPRLVTVPRPMFRSDAELPSPEAHGFYDNRVSDAKDTYPKYEGYFRNQIAFLKHLWLARRR